MEGISAIAQVEIKISGFNDDKPVIFNGLVLNEAMLSVNHFSFSLRPANNEGSLSAILSIKKQLLGKATEIKLTNLGNTNGHNFKGFVTEVNSQLSSDGYYEFYVTGSGKFCKVNELPEFHSHYQKSLQDIIKAAFKDSSLSGDVKTDLQTSGKLHYIVQYSKSPFAFAADLATRFGEWMFYNGEQLIIGKIPEKEPVELRTSRNDVSNLNIKAKAIKPPEASIGTDIYKSELLSADKKESEPDNDFLKASFKGGEILENPGKKFFVPSGFNKDAIESIHKKIQDTIVANSVFVTGNSRNASLSIGSIIKIIDAENDSGSKYIITQISHSASNASSYSNSFTSVPFEIKAPPYTNPLLFPKATPQAAIVTDNEDDKGLARVKVRFPWMAEEEKSPWISVIVPHSGKDKGFRFLPEKEDEVIIDFWDNNAETPFVNGAVYTDKNKSGIAEAGNNIKLIGTRTGRRFSIDDDKGVLKIEDKPGEKKGANLIELLDKDGERHLNIISGEDGDNHTAILMDHKSKKIDIYSQYGGDAVVNIMLDGENKKLTINTKGDIDITADGKINIEGKQEINLKSQKINIAADNELNMKGTAKANLSGTQIGISADAKLEMKGSAQAALEGAMLDLKGSGIANLQGGLVKIN